MTALVEKIAVEIVVSLCVGAVLGVVSALSSTPDEAAGQKQRLVCRRCGSDTTVEAEPGRLRPVNER
jgi:hypothetical protein